MFLHSFVSLTPAINLNDTQNQEPADYATKVCLSRKPQAIDLVWVWASGTCCVLSRRPGLAKTEPQWTITVSSALRHRIPNSGSGSWHPN